MEIMQKKKRNNQSWTIEDSSAILRKGSEGDCLPEGQGVYSSEKNPNPRPHFQEVVSLIVSQERGQMRGYVKLFSHLAFIFLFHN